jgi:hypothetical protein
MENENSDFLDNLPPEAECKAFLYRLTDNGSREAVAKYEFLPDVFDIGKQYGGGKYVLVVKYTVHGELKTTTRTFSIARDAFTQNQTQERPAGANTDNSSNIMVNMLSEFLKSQREQQNAGPKMPDLSGLLENTFNSALKVVESGLQKQQSAFSSLMQATIKNIRQSTITEHSGGNYGQDIGYSINNDYDNEDEEEDGGFMKNIFVKTAWQMAQSHIPALIQGTLSPDIIQSVKNSPLFQNIAGNPAAQKEFEFLIYEKFGAAAVDAVKQILF